VPVGHAEASPATVKRPGRWPRRISFVLLGAAAVALVATVAWTPRAGWFFVAFLIGAVASSFVQGVLERRWRARLPEYAEFRSRSTTVSVVRFVVGLGGGVAGALIGAEIATPKFSVFAGFVLGGLVARFVVLMLTSRRPEPQ